MPKNATKFIILCWYRPPTNNLDTQSFDAFEGILSKLGSDDKEVIKIGDTNCDLMSRKNGNTKRLIFIRMTCFTSNNKSEIILILLLK